MSGGAGTLETLAAFVGEALAPLAEKATPEALPSYLWRLGLALPPDVFNDGVLTSAASDVVADGQSLQNELPTLVDALAALDPDNLGTVGDVIAAGSTLTATIAQTVSDVRTLITAVEAAMATLPADVRAAASTVTPDLAARVIEDLLIDAIANKAPGLSASLTVFGIIEDVEEPGDATGIIPPYRRRRLALAKFAQALTDPPGYLRDTFRFGHANFTGIELFRLLNLYLKGADVPVLLLEPPNALPVFEAFILRLEADTSTNPPGLAADFRLPGAADTQAELPLGGPWTLSTFASAAFEAGLGITLAPNGALTLVPPSGAVSLSTGMGLTAVQDDAAAMDVLGVAGATRLTLERFDASVVLEAAWDSARGQATATPALRIALDGLRAEVNLGGGDSFLQNISGGGNGGADISLAALWSPADGLRIEGSSALEVAIPSHGQIGPATLDQVYLISNFDSAAPEPELPVEVSASVRGALGPLTASIDRVGIKLTFSLPPDGGNVGPMQVDAAFKPPNGIGLTLDGGGMKGGGYLYLDPASGEYSGALELKFQDAINLKAVGILNTVLPDGSQGFSLVVLISAEFTPIQLGFGFTLGGVGGLVGINRTMMLDVLSNGVRDGSIQSILFPEDVVANAATIIEDLQTAFPPLEGRYLIGPMAKMGWGTPTLVSLEMGVLLEIPRPAFAILGILSVVLPDEAVSVVEINVAFVGTVDFEKKELTFDASLFDSSILTFTLTGDMALRIYWGENANFLMSVGGFHPSYTPPPLNLPDLRRLAIHIMTGNPRLSAETYFAVTSNTVQFGGRIDAYAGSGIFSVEGFLSLDALIQFNPFYFIVDIAAMVAAKSGNTTLFSVRLSLTLEGPSPWIATGRATISISLLITDIDVSIRFSVTAGQARETSLPPIQIFDLVVAALETPENWRANALEGNGLLVSQRDIGDAAINVMHPMGSFSVAQKVLPLNTEIEHFGSRGIDGGTRYTLEDLILGTTTQDVEAIRDEFAPTQFCELSDSEKLSRPSFEAFDAGVTATASARPVAPFQRVVEVEHELSYIEAEEAPRRPKGKYALSDALFETFLGVNAVAKSPLARGPKEPTGLGTAKVSLSSGQFVIADTETLTQAAGTRAFASESEAIAEMARMATADPAQAGRLQVVAEFEVAA